MSRSFLIALVTALVTLTTTPATTAQSRPGHFLGELSWLQAEELLPSTPVVVLPFGAGAKEHGPHLPMNADLVVAEYLLERAVEALPVIVAPPITHGWFPAFREFPGTEVADPDVFIDYVTAVAKSLVGHGAQRLAILNTGVTRATGLPLSIVAREIHARTGTPTMVVSWDDLETEEVARLRRSGVDGHAGEVETSIHLFLQPQLVDMSRAIRDLGSGGEPYPGYRPGGFSRDPASPAYSTSGVLGDGTLGDAELGRKVLDILTEQWLLALRRFALEPTPRRDTVPAR